MSLPGGEPISPAAQPPRRGRALVAALVAVVLMGGAIQLGRRREPSHPAPAPATVSRRQAEAELTRVTLTPEAEARLDVRTARVESRAFAPERSYGAEVMAPAGAAAAMAAPVAGTVRAPRSGRIPRVGTRVAAGQVVIELVPFAPVDRDLRAQSVQRVAAARARFAALDAQAARADKLAAGKAGSQRAAEDATAQRDAARAELDAAGARLRMVEKSPLTADVAVLLRAPRAGVLRQLHVAAGQIVAAGAPLFEVIDTRRFWVRVPVFVDELDALDAAAEARIEALGVVRDGGSYRAHAIAAPPVADAAAATADLYYELDVGAPFRPGQRVGAALRLRGATTSAAAPWSAVVLDFDGGTWIYERAADHVFQRRRVAVGRVIDGWVPLRRGPSLGTEVVVAGAAELFGVEFGAGH